MRPNPNPNWTLNSPSDRNRAPGTMLHLALNVSRFWLGPLAISQQ